MGYIKMEGHVSSRSNNTRRSRKIAKEFNVSTGWKEYVDGWKEDMEKNGCTKYFNLLYLCKTIGHVPFDLHFVDAGHRYTMVLYFMNAESYDGNTN